jgi:hypothetical protein
MTNLCTWSVLFSFIDTILTSKALNNKCKRKTTDLNWHDLAYHKQLVQSYIWIFIHLKLYMWLRVILIEFTRDYLSASQHLNKTNFTFDFLCGPCHFSFRRCIFVLFVFALCFMYNVRYVFVDYSFLIAHSVFSNVYVHVFQLNFGWELKPDMALGSQNIWVTKQPFRTMFWYLKCSIWTISKYAHATPTQKIYDHKASNLMTYIILFPCLVIPCGVSINGCWRNNKYKLYYNLVCTICDRHHIPHPGQLV